MNWYDNNRHELERTGNQAAENNDHNNTCDGLRHNVMQPKPYAPTRKTASIKGNRQLDRIRNVLRWAMRRKQLHRGGRVTVVWISDSTVGIVVHEAEVAQIWQIWQACVIHMDGRA